MKKSLTKVVRIATAGELRRMESRAAKVEKRAQAAFEFVKHVASSFILGFAGYLAFFYCF